MSIAEERAASKTAAAGQHLWSVHLKPKPDELLSSWLVRLAHGHGVKLHSFCRYAFGRRKQVWTRDIDKRGDKEIEDQLIFCTATPRDRVKNTLLRSFEGIVYEHHSANGNCAFLNAIGVYHRLRRRFGMQFCARCLARDPYFRRRWRLSIAVYCADHRELLRDRCPACRSPINFHRGELGQKSNSRPRPMYHCFQCHYDLRESPRRKLPPQLSNELYALTRRHETIIASGLAALPYGEAVYSHLYFAVVRHLMVILGRRRNLRWLCRAAGEDLGFNWRIFRRRRRILEHQGVLERAAAIAAAEWLLREWPERTMQICRRYGVWASALLANLNPCPYWFYRVVRENLYVVYSPWRSLWEFERGKSYRYMGLSWLKRGKVTRSRSSGGETSSA